MSNIQTKPTAANIEQVLVSGDLKSLSSNERLSYYNSVCESLGLNPLTRPFEYITLNGRLVLYARKDATDQLRTTRRVSIKITARENIGDVYVVTAQASTADGRFDESTGAVFIKGLSGDNLANAYLKCETKAKRRVTLSICGLGVLDETEIESIRDAVPFKAHQVNALLNKEPAPIELEPEEEPDFLTEAAADPISDPGDYIIKIGAKHRGKKLRDLSPSLLSEFVNWVKKNTIVKDRDVLDFIKHADAFLEVGL